jgi:hypothetical protein
MEFRELRIPEDDEVLITLINARRDLLRVLTESNNFEYANGTRAAAAAPRAEQPPSTQSAGVRARDWTEIQAGHAPAGL